MFMRTLNRFFVCLFIFSAAGSAALAADSPFLGDWALTLPGGGAGWLGIQEVDGRLEASLMWGAGSVVPLASAKIEDDQLLLTRKHDVQHKDVDGKTIKTTVTEIITGTVEGDLLKLSSRTPRENGQGEDTSRFTGHRQPPPPAAPDLAKVKFGKPIPLFNGRDLTGWRLTDPKAINGWSVNGGILVNNPAQEEGKAHKNYGNL